MKHNLELDIKNCGKITSKVKTNKVYAQKLYHSLCNNRFVKNNDFVNYYSCSWRYAGGIIAGILCEGDYMDWYCSGKEGNLDPEVEEDFKRLGWISFPYPDDWFY